MSDMKYTEQHEWVTIDGDVATVGITKYATEQLGDIVFVELPDIGKSLAQSDEAAVVESVKAASEVYAPVGGEVTQVNEALTDNPGSVNDAPEADGWFLKLKVSDPSELSKLMDKASYDEFVGGLS